MAACQDAGIRVRMVTGDNMHTAQQIARECGLLRGGGAMEGPTFRTLDPGTLGAGLDGLEVCCCGALMIRWPCVSRFHAKPSRTSYIAMHVLHFLA